MFWITFLPIFYLFFFIVFTLFQVFLSLSFDDDLRRPDKTNEDNRVKNKKNRKGKNLEEPSQLPDSDKKKSRKELMTKMREEVFRCP